ncbi:MAG: hypothetical protein Q4P72_04310 [Eubacteriales bacterium]|nr:hypothetical protein [Eubacteriales bacterium]
MAEQNSREDRSVIRINNVSDEHAAYRRPETANDQAFYAQTFESVRSPEEVSIDSQTQELKTGFAAPTGIEEAGNYYAPESEAELVDPAAYAAPEPQAANSYEDFSSAVERYDRFIQERQNLRRQRESGAELLRGIYFVDYKRPFQLWRNYGRAKRYIVCGQVSQEEAFRRRKIEAHRASAWKYIIFAGVLILILYVLYRLDPLTRIQEILRILGYEVG